MSISITRKLSVSRPATNGTTLSSALRALMLSRDALAPKKLVNQQAGSDQEPKAAVSLLSAVQKTASKNKSLSWIPPRGTMLSKTHGGAEYWIEWKRVSGQGNGWKIRGYVYIYAKGKPQPSSKMAFDANNSRITKDGRLIVTLAHSQTQIEGTQKVNQTETAKVYYQFYSLYNRIKHNHAEKDRLVYGKKRTDVTAASADLLLFLRKYKKHTMADSSLGRWLRSNIGKLMKSKDLGNLVPTSVRLAVEASGLDVKLFGLKPKPSRGRKLAANIHDVLSDIQFLNEELVRTLLRRMRNAVGAGRPEITYAELQQIQRRLVFDLRNNLQGRDRIHHPFYGVLNMLLQMLVRPGFLGDGAVHWAFQDNMRQLLWEMMGLAADGGDVAPHREEMQQLIEDEVGQGDRADAIVNAIFDLDVFRPIGTQEALASAVSLFLNENRGRIDPNFDPDTAAAGFFMIGFQGRRY